MSENKEYAVTILRRRVIRQAKGIGQWIKVMRITYVAENMAPRTIRITEEEYTPELEKERIRKDIEKRLTEEPEAYTV